MLSGCLNHFVLQLKGIDWIFVAGNICVYLLTQFFNSCRCNSDGRCISAKLFCDFKKDCSDGSDEMHCQSTCNFESDTCGWQNTKIGDRMDWVRHQGLTPSNGTGPPTDHTTNSSRGRLTVIYSFLVSLEV